MRVLGRYSIPCRTPCPAAAVRLRLLAPTLPSSSAGVRLGLAGLLVQAAAAAHGAGSLLLLDEPPEQPTFSAGLTARGWPRAPGSARREQVLLPGLDYAGPSGLFASTDDGLGWNLAPMLLDAPAAKAWRLGARLWPQPGRSRRESPPGVERLGTRVVAQAFANVEAVPDLLLLQSGLSWGSGRHHDGGQLELGATSGIPLGKDLIAISLAATYANAAHLRGSFGVRAPEVQVSGLREFRPSSGWQDWSVAFNVEHKFDQDWSVSGQWLQARLIGAAATSPLTHRRSQPQFSASVWRGF